MFCKKCGNQLSDDAAFCVKCGTPTGLNESGISENVTGENAIQYSTSDGEAEALILDMMNSVPVMQKIKENENEIEENEKKKASAEKTIGKKSWYSWQNT